MARRIALTAVSARTDHGLQVRGRRNKAFVEWASSLMGMEEDQVESYRDTILALALRTARDDAIVERISLDLAMAGASVSQKQVRA